MSVQTPTPHPARTSVGAAVTGAILTLLIFAAMLLAFLLTPLFLLAAAAAVTYLFLRSRAARPRGPRSGPTAELSTPTRATSTRASSTRASDPATSAGRSPHGFGSGSR